MFQCNHYHQGAHYMNLLKLQCLKKSIKMVYVCRTVRNQVPNSAEDIHRQGPGNMQPHHHINHTNVF
jgi:hypothetical protein